MAAPAFNQQGFDAVLQQMGQMANTIQQLQQANQALQQGGGGAPPAAAAPRARHLPTTFFLGREQDDWTSFRRQFENINQFYGYEQQQGKIALFTCMKGQAAVAVADINHLDMALAVNDVLQMYELKFLPPAASKMARVRFNQARQEGKEDLLSYHGRMRALWMRAYPGPNQPEAMLIERFIRGIQRQVIRTAVDRANPADYDAALAAAQHEKSVQDQEQYHTTGHMPGLKTNLGADAMDIGALTLEEQEKPGDINAVTPQTQCYNCKGYGHIQSKCWKRKMIAEVAEVHAALPQGKTTPNKRVSFIIRNRNAAPRRDPRREAERRTTGNGGERKQYVRRFLNEICEILGEEEDEPDDDDTDPEGGQNEEESGDEQPDF